MGAGKKKKGIVFGKKNRLLDSSVLGLFDEFRNADLYAGFLRFIEPILVNIDDRPFQERIEALRREALEIKVQFLKDDLSKLKGSQEMYPLFLLSIANYYMALSFFPDPEITARFIKWGFPRPKLKWMTPLNEIVDEIENIGKDGRFKLIKLTVLENICLHLQDKILNEVLQWGKITASNRKPFDLEQFYRLIFRRMKDGGGSLKSIKEPGEEIMQNMVMHLESQYREVGPASKYMLNKVRGNTADNYLKGLVNANIQIDVISESEYLRCLYNLFRIICKDVELLTNQGFEKKIKSRLEEQKDVQGVSPLYDGDYNFYQVSRLKKLIFRN